MSPHTGLRADDCLFSIHIASLKGLGRGGERMVGKKASFYFDKRNWVLSNQRF